MVAQSGSALTKHKEKIAMPKWITDQVVLSGETITAQNWPQLATELGVTAIVNMRAEHQDTFVQPLPAAYLWLPTIDFSDPGVEQLLYGAQFIHAAVQAGHKVLVHCRAGIGRSATMVAAYLVWTGLSVKEAMQQVEGPSLYYVGPAPSRHALQQFSIRVQESKSL